MRSAPIRRLSALIVLCFVLAPAVAGADKEATKAEKKKAEIDTMAQQTLDRLFSDSERAKSLFDDAYGYAVFDARQTKLLLAGGGGNGVAVERASGRKTYMKQATVGVGLGLGIQIYQVVFLFEDQGHFDTFVEEGWEVSAGANAVAGDQGQNANVSATDPEAVAAGANAAVAYTDGVAVFQFTEKGLMLQADISGTKYWKPDKLNEP